MNLAEIPVAQKLFAQWQRARGSRVEQAIRPFARSWEELLDQSRLDSGADRAEAEEDARRLEKEGWVELKPVRYKPYLIDSVVIPLEAETRWCEAFGFVRPTGDEMRQIASFSWEPEMAFLRETRINIPFVELRKINEFVKTRANSAELAPIKERSIQIFGDEKRLDFLAGSVLFRPGRLDMATHLRCEVVPVPLAWKRGPAGAASQPVIAIENAATWHSYCRWNVQCGLFGAVIYGDGNRFMDGVGFLAEIFAELGGSRRVFYFGDIDPQGLLIPQQACKRAQSIGLPPVEPHLWSYRLLLALNHNFSQWEGSQPSPAIIDWIGECAAAVRELFAKRQRLAQELIGWEFLRLQQSDD